MSAPLCFLDTETDGVHPDRLAWEIAIIRREPDGAETEWHTFVDVDMSTADPFGLRVGRFYDRHPMGQFLAGGDASWVITQPRDAALAVARMTHGAHIVGAVPNFDTECLDRLLRVNGLLPAWHYTPWCVKTLVVGYLRGRGEEVDPRSSSDDLSTRMGVYVEKYDRHTALGDAQWARDLYDAVMSAGVR